MGACASVEKDDSIINLIYGPETIIKSPLEFHSNDSLWRLDLDNLVNNIQLQCIMTSDIIHVILDYIKPYIYQSIVYPYQYIIDTAIYHSTESLQPYRKEIKNNKSQETKPKIKYEKMSRKSYSIFDEELINKEIIKNQSGIKELIEKHIKYEYDYEYKYKFHEIVVYEQGGHFTKHVDTIYKSENEIEYNHTLLLIPPNDYKGGELIIYNKKNKIKISSNKTKWTYIIFNKYIEHECKPILNGYKIVFKIHIALYQHNDLEVGDVAFEPMATGIPGMNRPIDDAFQPDSFQQNLVSDVEQFQYRQQYQ